MSRVKYKLPLRCVAVASSFRSRDSPSFDSSVPSRSVPFRAIHSSKPIQSIHRMMLFLVLVTLVPLLTAASTPTPTYYTYHDLYTKLQTTPPNRMNQASLIDSLLQIVPSYVFHAVSMDSTKDVDPSIAHSVIPMHVNLTSSLQSLNASATTFTSDAEWQQAVANVFIPLHDAHTRYNKPSPYYGSSYQQPIILSTRINQAGHPSLYISAQPSLLDHYDSLYNVTSNITAYNGWTIALIDGEDAVQHIVNFANEKIGYTKDLTSRINLAINGYGDGKGYWASRQQQAFGAPEHDHVTYTLINPVTQQRENLTLNWIGVSTAPFTIPPKQHVTELESIAQLSQWHVHGNDDDVVSSSQVTFQMWSDHTTGILKISTFNPGTTANYALFIGAIQSAIIEHRTKAPNGRLLIDLRANGGGDICLGYATLRYIFPSLSDGTVWPSQFYVGDITGINGRYEMMHSDLFSLVANAAYKIQSQLPQNQTACGIDPEVVGYTTPCAWFDPITGSEYVNTSFLDGPIHNRGGYPQQYSRLIHEGCSVMDSQWTPPTHKGYTPDQVLLVSDGLCGSTCSVFSSFIQQHGLGKTVVLSTINTTLPQQFWSFPGGEVEEIGYIRNLTSRYNLQDDPLTPHDLPDNATFRFAIRQIYPWNEPRLLMPLEFIHVPAHFQIVYNFTYNDTNAIYSNVILLFDTCVAGVGDATYPCHVGHGTGYYPCINGRRDVGSCVIATCDDGYYLKNGMTCEGCPVGTYRVANSSTSLTSCDACTNINIDHLSSSSITCTTVYTGTAHDSPNCPVSVDCSSSTRNLFIVGGASGVGAAILVGGLVFCVMNRKMKRAQGLDETLLA